MARLAYLIEDRGINLDLPTPKDFSLKAQSPDYLYMPFLEKQGKGYQGYMTNFGKTCEPQIIWLEESIMGKSAKIDRVRVPAARGGTIDVKKGQYICVLDIEGGQCTDFWAFDRKDFDHVMSPVHFFIDAMRIQPKVGDKIVTNRRVPIVTIVHDDVGWHDMLVPSCDNLRYEYHYGVKGHRNCCDNFREAMSASGKDWGSRPVPHPFNIFMNTFVKGDGTLVLRVPTSMAGDRLIMQAEMDIIAAASSCPMDLNETGARGITDVELLVSDSLETLQNVKI